MSENAIQPVSSADVEELTQDSTADAPVETPTETTAEAIVEATVVSTVDMSTILLHNDEVTPYEYVINLLGDLFMLSEELADHIAWTAHNKGTAVVVMRPRVEAEKLVKVARARARTNGYPLNFTLEQN